MRDVEDAVDPVADDQLLLVRLDVDVARPVLGRLEDHRVDEAHERRVRDAVVGLEVVVLRLLALEGDHLVEGGVHRPRRARQAAQLGEDVLLCSDVELDRLARPEPQLVERPDVVRVRDRDLEDAVADRERDRDDPGENRQGDRPDGVVVDADDGEVDRRQLVALGEQRSRFDLEVVDEPQLGLVR
jgi:hypothetical protein